MPLFHCPSLIPAPPLNFCGKIQIALLAKGVVLEIERFQVFNIRPKGVFLTTLVVGVGNWKFLSSNFFDPLHKRPKLFDPLNKCKNVFDLSPIARYINISFFPQHQFIWYALGVPVTLKNWFYKALFLHGQTRSQVFQLQLKGLKGKFSDSTTFFMAWIRRYKQKRLFPKFLLIQTLRF